MFDMFDIMYQYIMFIVDYKKEMQTAHSANK